MECREMQPPQKHSWINLSELKDQLTRKLGPERSHQYFDYLNRFLSLKLSKVDFNKLCSKIVGRDNISLHNQLIRSILKNVCARKFPPPTVGNKKVYHGNGSIPVVHSSKKIEKQVSTRNLLHAPLGIPRISGTRKALSFSSNNKCVGVFDTGDLIDSVRLKERMDQLSATQGLQGVSVDCASVLNNGLNAYLKGLIRSFVRSGLNYPIQSQSWSFQTMQEREPKRPISLLDFTVAMELNPRQLGEDWPVLLEKICTHAKT